MCKAQEDQEERTLFERIVYRIEESWSESTFQASCVELGVIGFGDTSEEARSALKTQIACYLEDCEELGVLEDVLIDAGFYDNGEVWMSSLLAPVPEPKIRFFGHPADFDLQWGADLDSGIGAGP